MSLSSLPAVTPEPLPFTARGGLLIGMVALHAVLAWALWRPASMSSPAGEAAPLEVQWIAPPAPAVMPSPQPAPKPASPRLSKPNAAPRPVPAPPAVSVAEAAPDTSHISTPPPVAPAPVTAPLAPPAPVAPAVVEAAPAPAPASAAATAPALPAPKTVAITSVRYLVPPVLEYPLASRRLREQGRVEVRLLVDAMGLPQQAQVVRTSGYQRLDEAALATVRATRFKPYTENGVPQSFWVVMPLVFELEN